MESKNIILRIKIIYQNHTKTMIKDFERLQLGDATFKTSLICKLLVKLFCIQEQNTAK